MELGKQSRRQGHLAEFRVDMTRLSWVMWGDVQRKGKGRDGNKVRQAREQRYTHTHTHTHTHTPHMYIYTYTHARTHTHTYLDALKSFDIQIDHAKIKSV